MAWTTQKDYYVELGDRIRRVRVMAGLTQSATAKALGVTFQQLQKYELGINRISAGTLMTLADALGVHPALLLTGSSEIPQEPPALSILDLHVAAKVAKLSRPQKQAIARLVDEFTNPGKEPT